MSWKKNCSKRLRASTFAYCTFRAECIVLFETPEGYHGHDYWQRVVLREIHHVDTVPTNCECKGPIRQQIHGSRVARGMEKAAARIDEVHTRN